MTAGPFLAGLIAMCFAAVGLCFARFWSLNRDPLLITFALAFWLLALQQTLVGLAIVPPEEQSWVYLLRVTAFVLIAIAVVRKNVQASSAKGESD
jgi:Family of unknown function (DUF5985)